ncbi:MAG: arsenosugar biosynthesis radical SAM (seleno)protein ArsS [Phycisphaerae bacterium]
MIPTAATYNIGGRCFEGYATTRGPAQLRAIEVTTLQVSLGLRCNQTCRHCHVDAGPHRTETMSREIVDAVLEVLRRHSVATLDITGGAPEMNPDFRYLVAHAVGLCRRVIDRCNLTIFFEPGYDDLPEFLAGHGVEITASLPCYEPERVDGQRGAGTFDKSIAALQRLNALGYGKPGTSLELNLVYNPTDPELPPPQAALERQYKHELSQRFGIVFNRLFAMTNMPINRFRRRLEGTGQYDAYVQTLAAAFNPAAVEHLMCRHQVSVGWDGRLYDCDFNHMSGVSLRSGLPHQIRDFDAALLRSRRINTCLHCFGCTAGAGSSCSGALTVARAGDDRAGTSTTVVTET